MSVIKFYKTLYLFLMAIGFSIALFLSPITCSESILRESSGETEFFVELLVDGLGVPWGLEYLNSNELLVTERGGSLKLIALDSRNVKTISGLPDIAVSGQGGLMDVAIPADYQSTGWIYFTYTKNQNNKMVTVLARAKLEDAKLHHWQDVLITKSASNTARHFGSRIAFDNNGHIFFSVGDRGHRPNGQDLQTHAGSVLRLNLDGSVPVDNPFIDDPQALPEIWSYGHRNPQGLAYDQINNRLWLIEHGPRGGDEINLVEKGKNYGWPVISYGKEYRNSLPVGEGTSRPGMEQPIKYFVPSIAPGSLLLYSGKMFPQWQGNLFAGALSLTHLNRLTLDKDLLSVTEDRLLEHFKERIRDVIEDEKGRILFSTDSGKLFIIRTQDSK